VEKVSHATATELLQDGVGVVTSVGTSLGSFSMSVSFLLAMMTEYSEELISKTNSLDTDPHFWMPLTLSRSSYLSIMKQKGKDEAQSGLQYDRMANFAKKTEWDLPMFGAVDVGKESYWWDYGQLRLYYINNMLATLPSDEAGKYKSERSSAKCSL